MKYIRGKSLEPGEKRNCQRKGILCKITPPWAGLAPEEHSKNQILKIFYYIIRNL